MEKTIKSGKNKEGKPEGARYNFIDLLPLIVSHTEIEKLFSSALNDFIYAKTKNHSDVIFLVDLLHRMNIYSFELWENLTNLRNQAIISGKYSPLSYKEKIEIDDLLDAVARHWIKHLFINPIDVESKCSHLAHILANLIIIAGQLNDNSN